MEWFGFWLLFVLIFLLLPVGYGWGYQKWGAPPYPYYYRSRRRRGSAPADPYRARRAGEGYPSDVVVSDEENDTWGFLGDVVWIALAIAVGWLLLAWIL